MSAPLLATQAQSNPNPFMNTWSGPYGGVPAFDQYHLTGLQPAIEAAIQDKLTEITKIADNPQPATFTNTIVALEKAGKKLSQIRAVFDIYSSNMSRCLPVLQPYTMTLIRKN